MITAPPSARSPHPEPTSQACTRPSPKTTLGSSRPMISADACGAAVADHARSAVDGAEGGQHPGARVRRRTGVDADHPAGVLVAGRAGDRPARCHVLAVPGGQGGSRSPTRRVRCRPARSARTGSPGRLDQVTGLEVAEGDRPDRPDRVAGQQSGVGHHPGRQVDREDRDGPRNGGGEQCCQPIRQPRSPADAEHAVDDQVDRRCRSCSQSSASPVHKPTTGGPQRRQTRRRAADRGQRTAVTAQPRRARRAPANSASPPLFPGPTRAPHERRTPCRGCGRAARRTGRRQPWAARCINAPSPTAAIVVGFQGTDLRRPCRRGASD